MPNGLIRQKEVAHASGAGWQGPLGACTGERPDQPWPQLLQGQEGEAGLDQRVGGAVRFRMACSAPSEEIRDKGTEAPRHLGIPSPHFLYQKK